MAQNIKRNRNTNQEGNGGGKRAKAWYRAAGPRVSTIYQWSSHWGPDFITVCTSAGIKIVLSELTRHAVKNYLWKGVDSKFCDRPYCIRIWRSSLSKRKIGWRRIFKSIMHHDLLRLVVGNLLQVAPLLNDKIKHVLFYAWHGCKMLPRGSFVEGTPKICITVIFKILPVSQHSIFIFQAHQCFKQQTI